LKIIPNFKYFQAANPLNLGFDLEITFLGYLKYLIYVKYYRFFDCKPTKMLLNDAESKIVGADFTAQWFFEKQHLYHRLQFKGSTTSNASFTIGVR
jgi:hypothetical protein